MKTYTFKVIFLFFLFLGVGMMYKCFTGTSIMKIKNIRNGFNVSIFNSNIVVKHDDKNSYDKFVDHLFKLGNKEIISSLTTIFNEVNFDSPDILGSSSELRYFMERIIEKNKVHLFTEVCKKVNKNRLWLIVYSLDNIVSENYNEKPDEALSCALVLRKINFNDKYLAMYFKIYHPNWISYFKNVLADSTRNGTERWIAAQQLLKSNEDSIISFVSNFSKEKCNIIPKEKRKSPFIKGGKPIFLGDMIRKKMMILEKNRKNKTVIDYSEINHQLNMLEK